MAWDEWEQLKSDVAARTAHMQLNQAPGPTGGVPGGGGELVVRDDQLGQLGHMAFDLHQRFHRDADFARPSTEKAAADLKSDGLDTGAALASLHDAWKTQQQALEQASAHISNHLDFTRAQHAKDDAKIATTMRDVKGQPMTESRISQYFQ